VSAPGSQEAAASPEPVSTFWKDRRVFVTGATGLLGSHLVEALLARDADVTCLVRDWVPRARTVEEGWIEGVNRVRGELEDPGVLVRAVNEYEIDTVLHLGAQTIVGTAARSPVSTFESNVRGTWNLLEACRACSRLVQRIVVASSDKAYGAHERLPYTEDTPLEGRYPYDASKAAADLIATSYSHTYGLPLAIARCGNLFGPGDLNWNRLIPGTIRSALRGESPVIRSDGTHVRDWFYVKDAVDAYLLLAERLPDRKLRGQAFNFGTELPLSVLDVVARILKIAGQDHLEPTILDEAANEIPRQFLDCSKARALLGWRPRKTMEDGLRETIEWYRRCVKT
jgi:CDP-glucose 4,6-dehydratase